MRGRLSSLTRCICYAVATWCAFCPEIRRKTKTIAFCCNFFTAKFEWRPKNKVFTPVYAIFIRLIEMKTKANRFHLTVLLFVVLLCNICSILRYMLFCAIFDRHIWMKTKQIRKQRHFRLTLFGGTLDFPLGEAKSQMGDANYRWGDSSLLQSGYIYIYKLWPCFITKIPLRLDINISCKRVKL